MSKAKAYRCQQILLHPDEDTRACLEFICSEANKLANCSIYYCRQFYFQTKRYISKYALSEVMKTNLHFKALRSACAQQVCHDVVESFISFKKLLNTWFQGRLEHKPKLPKYRKKGGLALVSCPARWIKRTPEGNLKFPLGKKVKAWFGIDHFLLPMPSNLRFEEIKEFRILPRNNSFYLECVYHQQTSSKVAKNSNVLGLDPGLDNWLTGVSTTGKSFIVDGKQVKAQNQLYNKKVALVKKGKASDYWDEELSAITEKRNRQMRDNINKAARFVINWCLSNDISTMVFGWNKRQKDSINIGKQNNQSFVQIPTQKLKIRISQLCDQYGLRFIETEESYTSKSSFLDDDFLPTVGEKPDGWKPSGRRVKRGSYKTAQGALLAADCNGASNILRKVLTQLEGTSLAKVTRASLSVPQRYSLDRLSQVYRKRVEARLLDRVDTSA